MDGDIIDDRFETDDEFKNDLDSLYILPLRMLPLKSNLFRRAKMIKDYRLETSIEVFSNEETGSGRIYLDELDPDEGRHESTDFTCGGMGCGEQEEFNFDTPDAEECES